MRSRIRWFSTVIGAVFAGFALPSCDDPESTPFVTIAGIVRNVDNGSIAAGVRVRLYGTNYQDEVATGTDGKYSLVVPKGSKLQLFTDDFDNATTDTWFPLVNVDLPHIYANEDMLDWPIHCCPKTACPELGSVAAWDRYLQEADDAGGDRFVPTTALAAGGILAILFLNVVATVDTIYQQPTEGLSCTSSTPAFPIAYLHDAHFWGDSGPDCAVGPEVFYPADRTVTDFSGGIFSFGDPAYTGTSVTLAITDQDLARNYAISTPWEVPVAPGMITLCLAGVLNDVPNRPFRDVACAAGFFTCSP